MNIYKLTLSKNIAGGGDADTNVVFVVASSIQKACRAAERKYTNVRVTFVESITLVDDAVIVVKDFPKRGHKKEGPEDAGLPDQNESAG